MTKQPELPVLCGVILHPAGHTLSPLMHAAAYRELGLDAQYQAFDVRASELADALVGMRALGIRQLSVSLPHKPAVLGLADRCSPEAQQIGAANTLTRVGDQIVADNTDWIGVVRTLERLDDWKGQRATVVGAGGVARAVVFALCHLGMSVTIVNRSRQRAQRLVADLDAVLGSLDDPCDLLVNATPVGMHPDIDATPIPQENLGAGATVFDTVYRPLETRLLREARERGCRVQDGLDMLVHQATEQVALWAGARPDAARLRAAALLALDG